MRRDLARRGLILGAGASALAVGYARGGQPELKDIGHPYWPNRIALLERQMGGRLGVFAAEVGSDNFFAYRENERFPMCSTFKLSLAAAMLEAADQGKLNLGTRLPYGRADLLEYAPTTRDRVAEGGMTIIDLCRAAVELSDNTAANLLLTELGGPSALTARWRAWGDDHTRLDRNEPSLNSSIPGDPRDTTTPSAMAYTLEVLLNGPTLKSASQNLLLGWMRNCQTGLHKLRAGLPAGLTIGDKTGNSGTDTMGDLAIIETPGSRTYLVACYLTEAKVDAKAQDAVFAEVGRMIADFFHLAPAHG